MLSDEEKRRIGEEARRYPARRAALSEALMIAQEARGWVSDEILADVAGELGISPASAESVATFYELVFRRPVGAHIILICDSVSCWIRGGETLIEALEKRLGIELGGTTADGLFTLLPAGCLGLCERAPAIMIDDEVYGELTLEKLDALIDGIRRGVSRGESRGLGRRTHG
jgi:NADH-quinone oxidoreductase subunit E